MYVTKSVSGCISTSDWFWTGFGNIGSIVDTHLHVYSHDGMDGRLKASVVIHVVTMAMDGRLSASVVIWSVEAHESQEVDHVMSRGPNIGIYSFSIVYYYTSYRPIVSIVYCNWCESCYNNF